MDYTGLKTASIFLEELMKLYPPEPGQHHALMFENGLQLCLFNGDIWHTFNIEESDMLIDPKSLAVMIINNLEV